MDAATVGMLVSGGVAVVGTVCHTIEKVHQARMRMIEAERSRKVLEDLVKSMIEGKNT